MTKSLDANDRLLDTTRQTLLRSHTAVTASADAPLSERNPEYSPEA